MAGRKEYELLFKLKASLGGNFESSFKNAINTTKQLQNSLSKINSLQGKIDGFQRQTQAIASNKEKLAELNAEHDRLKQKMSQTEQPSESLTKKFEKNTRQIEQLTQKISAGEAKLHALGNELQSAGIDTDNLEAANSRLAKSYATVKKSQENIARVDAALQKNSAEIGKVQGHLRGTIAVAGGLAAAFYNGPVKAAMEFQSNMSDVVKVVDGLKDEKTGQLTEEYGKMKSEILDLSTKIPMTTKGITEIAAAAGQAGIARKEIVPFAEDAAKMGIAFDTTAAQAGEWMAKWRTSFRMSQEEVVSLSDKINYLSNTSAANAAQISSVVTKIGPLGEVAGLASGEIAALGATLVSVGINEDVAATGIKKVATTMTAGNAATKRQKEVLDKLGISATNLAKNMQTDAKGAILSFLGAVQKLPKAEQAAALKNYFGEEAVASIAPLLTNLPKLKEQFEKVGDASQYAGSMEAEYAARSDTTENKVLLAKNNIHNLSIVLGDTFLPYVGQAAEKLSELVKKFADFAEANPELIKQVTKVVGAFLAFDVVGNGLKLGFLHIRQGALDAQKVFEAFRGKIAKTSADTIGLSSKLKNAGGGVKQYFESIEGLMGKSKAGSGILSIADKMKTSMSGAFKAIGGKAKGVFGIVQSLVTNGPLGKMGAVIEKGFGKITTFLSPVKNALSTVFAPLGKVGGLLGKGMGGLFGKIMPVIMILSLLATAFKALSGEDSSAFFDTLKQAGEELKPVLQTVMQQFKDLGAKIMPVLMETVNALAPLFGDIIKAILPVVTELISQLAPLLVDIIEQILPVILGAIKELAPLFAKIITDLLPVFLSILQILLPVFTQIVTSVLPIISGILATITPIIADLVNAIMPTLLSILNALMPVIQVVADLFGNVLGAQIDAISQIIGGLMKILKGLITFITGVFTGDWTKAWEGIKSIFSGIWESIKGVCKGVVNSIIGIINTVTSGINKIKIPGTKGANIPQIPKFAKGTKNSPKTFIAGEEGPELITNAKGRTVFTAAQTTRMLEDINTARQAQQSGIKQVVMVSPQLINALSTARVPANVTAAKAPTVTAGTENRMTITLTSNPVIYANGSDPEKLKEQLAKHDEELLNKMDERIRQKADKERRGRYE